MIYVNARFLTQNITGVQRFAIEIAKELKKTLGKNVCFVSPKNIINSNLVEQLEVIVVGNKTGHLWEQIDLPKYLKKNNSPLLLCLGNTAPLFYTNKVVTIYDLAFYHHPEWFSTKFTIVYNFLIPKICKNSKHIFTDSDYVKKDISKSYNIDINKITTIHGSYAEIFRNNNLKDDNFVLAVGSVDPRKNLISLIDIFKRNSSISLKIVGERNKVFSSLDLTDLPKNIVFTGYVDDNELVKLYNEASLFVYPSFFEGFGIPPLEAQACGCPVISSNRTSMPEVGLDSVIYCDPYKIEDMEEKIIKVLNNNKLKEDLIQKGFENIKRFSWEKSANMMIKTIKGLN